MKQYGEKTAQEVEKLVKPTYLKLKVWTHGWLHVKNVAKAAQDLAKMEGVDPVLCKIAGYCHDLGRLEEEEQGLTNPIPGTHSPHAGFGVKPTKEILQKVGITGDDAKRIIEAVRIHNVKKYEGDNEIALILQDADRSDGFGKVAILRFAAFNCEMPVHEPKTSEDIDQELTGIKEVFKTDKDLKNRMVQTIRYAFDWVDELANTKSLKKYVHKDYQFNKQFLDEIEKY